ncbi:MAG TPA: nucleotidyltransferase family protein [Gemmatimonadaceae bacterium]
MIAGVLLAAGGARRFHSQKLVATLDGVPVVRHSADVLASQTDRLVVVVGNQAVAVKSALAGVRADFGEFVENDAWETGLASSLRVGIAALSTEVEAAVVTLGDQPRLDPAVVGAVVDAWRRARDRVAIVSASYRGVRAHPVVFAREVFPELLALEGDAGARLLIERSPGRVAYVDVDAAMPRDVDTPEDLEQLQIVRSAEGDADRTH